MGVYVKIHLMKKMTKIEKISSLLKKAFFTAADARKLGVHPSLLHYYIKKGLIERVGRGIYKNPSSRSGIDFQWEDLVLTVRSISRGVVCLVSALSIYKLTEEIPKFHWIAVPHSTTVTKRKKTKIMRMRNIELGRTEITIAKEKIRIFDRERTIIDAFKHLSKETAIKALQAGFQKKSGKKLDIRKIKEYSKKLRIKIDPYLLMVTT